MGYLLKEALKTLCGVNQWCYAIFWKIGCQNPKLLIWEECYYEPIMYSNSGHGMQATNKVHLLVTKMMKDNYINLLGEGLVGRVAFTRNHQWIVSDNKMLVHPSELSNEVSTQISAGIQTIAVIPVHPHGVVQLGSSSTIMENIGFVNDVKSLISQLGCVPGALLSDIYMKNEDVMETTPCTQEPICHGNSIFAHSSGKSKVADGTLFTPDSCNKQGFSHSPQASGSSGHTSLSFGRCVGDNQVAKGSTLANSTVCHQTSTNFDHKIDQTAFGSFSEKYNLFKSMGQHSSSGAFLGDHADTIISQVACSDQQLFTDAHFLSTHVDTQPKQTSDKDKLEHELFQALTMSSEEACLKPPSRDDLFDIVGMDFENKVFSGSRNNFVNNGVESNLLGFRKYSMDLEPFSVYEGESDSGIYSSTASDHLLDAVVSKVQSSLKPISDDIMSYSSLTKTSSSSAPVNCSSSVWATQGINLMQKELLGVPKSLKSSTVTSSYSYKEDGGNFSDTSSVISSQISSWADQRNELKKDSGVGSGNAKKTDEISKSNRKRLKPGDNPRPRPKDRQMIQDRVKELREIVPNGAKCSIDALLERTIKHMLFLQNVTKHAAKLNKVGDSKNVSKDGGLLLRDNFEGGATWAYEVGSQTMVCPRDSKNVSKDGGLLLSDNFEGGATWAYKVGSQTMVCPIKVEDLNSPRQMLVEMLCEERGSFLEIADIIKGLGLTILKGVMESRNDKIWAHFTVEVNRDVTRMEIFLSLVSLFDQASKNGADCSGNMNVPVHEQSFPQMATNAVSVGPRNIQ